jgi:hypothetical protein
MFDDVLRRMRDSGIFENDNPQRPGRPAAPLSLKLMAVLRLLAIGCLVGAVAGMCGIGRTTIQVFFPVQVWGMSMVLVSALAECALPECLMMCMYVLPSPHMVVQMCRLALEGVI